MAMVKPRASGKRGARARPILDRLSVYEHKPDQDFMERSMGVDGLLKQRQAQQQLPDVAKDGDHGQSIGN